MLLDKLGASSLGNILSGKDTIIAGEAKIRGDQGPLKIMSPHTLTNFKTQKYYQNEPNGVYSINNLLKMKNGVYVINLDEFKSIGTHWIALYVNRNNATYFDSFRVEDISKKN